MAEQTKVLRSEHTKDMSPEELAELQEKVGQMSEEELKAFRNSMNPDDMGFFGEESVDDDSTKDYKLIQHTAEDSPVPDGIDTRYHQVYRARQLNYIFHN